MTVVTGRVLDTDPLPRMMEQLPIDEAGRPIPWFAAVVDGVHDFRFMDDRQRRLALRAGLCWVCGKPLYADRVYVIGPMCTVNRTTAEPPSHPDCAAWSSRNCPFLANPAKVRREAGTPDKATMPGIGITRNPGVMALWTTRKFTVFPTPSGLLIKLGDPSSVQWMACGRPATRAEVEQSIETGLPVLREMAEDEGRAAVRELDKLVEAALVWLPTDA